MAAARVRVQPLKAALQPAPGCSLQLDPPPHAPSESESAVPRRMASERRLGLAGRGPGPFTEVTMREAASPPAKDVAWVSIVSLC